MKTKKITLFLMFFLLVSAQSYAKRVYVKLVSDASAWSGVAIDANNVVVKIGDGGDYPAFSSIDFNETGLNLQNGDELWVAKGSYKFLQQLTGITNSITIYGGFIGTETSPSQRIKTDLDGNGLIERWEFLNGTKFTGLGNNPATSQDYNMMKLNNGKTLDGIIICDAYYVNSSAAAHGGGGEFQRGSLIRNSIIRNISSICKAGSVGSSNGGGIYLNQGSMDGCLVENNSGDYFDTTNNPSWFGGGVYINGGVNNDNTECTGYLINSVIRNNRAGSANGCVNNISGVGIYANNGARIENCLIYSNTGELRSATLFGTQGNQVRGIGGFGGSSGNGQKKGTIWINCSFLNNHANLNGSTISQSGTVLDMSGSYDVAYNCILWNNMLTKGDGTQDHSQSILRIQSGAYMNYMCYNVDANTPINGAANNTNKDFKVDTVRIKTEGVFYPMFSNDYAPVGAANNEAEELDIKESAYTLKDNSPLHAFYGTSVVTGASKTGVYTPSPYASDATNSYLFSTTDLMGAKREDSKWLLGPYQYSEYDSLAGVSTIDKVSSIKVFVNNDKLIIEGLSGISSIAIYDVNGALQSITTTLDATKIIPAPARGLYIVRVANVNDSNSVKVSF